MTKRQHWRRLGGFALVLGVVSLLTTWVGLSGSWVADDWHMVDNYLYADWAELGAVFKRNAAYYLFTDDKVGPYRPVTMLTLLATHLLAPEPWLHHAVSWMLHALTAFLLFVVLRQHLSRYADASKGVVDSVSALFSGIFLLHPVHVESYVWINGRSDLLGGFWLVALAFLVGRGANESSRRVASAVVIGLVAFLGASSKLPFAIAAAAIWLAWALRDRSPLRGIFGAAIAVGVGAHLVLRMIFAPFRGQLGTSDDILLDTGVWLALPRLFVQGIASLMALRAEAMQSLSWVLFGPWSFYDWVGLVVIVLALFGLVRRRDWFGLVYFIGAFLTLAPVAVVSRSFWMGFDRYLYMPAVLLFLAAAPYVLRGFVRGTRDHNLAIGALWVGLLFGAAAQTHHAGAAFASQKAYDQALLRDHPDDPTTHYYLARAADRSGDMEAVEDRLSVMPPPPWPGPIIVPTYELAAKVSDISRAHQAIDALVASQNDGVSCAKVRHQLEIWRGRAPDEATTDALTATLERLSCEP
ncbi:MAG: hypothetical protein OEM16_05675 [Myxococcales bacterium]|nr:hypothetical protein [Myxococcales bacterium]